MLTTLPKIKRKAYNCLICHHDCYFHFYGVRSCEGCKQFFRRVVIKRLRYICQKKQECEIIKGDRCRGCRLSKCLLVGMDPKMVQIDESENDVRMRGFIEYLVEKQRELWKQHGIVEEQLNEYYTNPFDGVQRLMSFLAPLERVYSRIWSSATPLPSVYFHRHANMFELLHDNQSKFLQSANTYFPDESNWDKAAYLDQLEKQGFCDSKYIAICAKDWYLCFEGAKTMPFFRKLTTSDQKALLVHIINVVNGICGAYHSSRTGANKTMTRGNGLTAISFLEAKQFRNDQRLHSMYQQINNDIVERIASVGLGYDEYLLLFALAFIASDASGLSPPGRELLYAESVLYSQALHKLFQAKFGTFVGAQKFAASMNLLASAKRRKFMIEEFVTHIEFFYDKKPPMDAYPIALAFDRSC